MKVLGFNTGSAVPRYAAWKRFIEELPLHHPLGSVILSQRRTAVPAPPVPRGKGKLRALEGSPAPAPAAAQPVTTPEFLRSTRAHVTWLSRALSTFPHTVRLISRERAILQTEGDRRLHDAATPPSTGGLPTADLLAAETALTWDNCVVLAAEEETTTAVTTIAVPVHDREGDIIAAIDVTAAAVHAGPEHLLMLAQTAMAIEHDLDASANAPAAVAGEPGVVAVGVPSVPREKDRLARLLEVAPVLIYVTDAKERVLYMNGRAQADWGRSAESVVGKSLQQLFSADTAEAISANNRTVRQAKTAMQFEETVEQGDRIRQYLSVRAPLRAFEDRPDTVGAVCIDITAHKQADRHAVQHARQMRELIDAAPALFDSGSVRAVLQGVAGAARAIVGGHRATASLVSSNDVGRLLQATSLADADRSTPSEDEARAAPIDAVVFHVASPLRLSAEHAAERGMCSSSERDAGGRATARAWMAVPLLSQERANAGLIQIWHAHGKEFSEEDEAVVVQLARIADVAIRNAAAHEELQRSDRRKDEFLALLGHELRNPLAPMRNATGLLGEKNPPEENILYAKNVIERQVNQMTRMVDDLLDMGRIVSGKFVFQRQPVRLNDIVSRTMEMCLPMFESKRQTLSVTSPGEDAWVDADAGRLSQVLANLLNNASKFTPEGGTVSLHCERRDGVGVITVTDTGKGIPNDMLKEIFGLFVQVDRPDAGAPGLGLGLWLARNLVEMQGGRISARSAGLGTGSEFAVTLPLLAAPPATTASEIVYVTAARDHSAKARQVLVVDDDKDNADSIALLLTGEGCDVRVAYSGTAALEATADWSPDIVLMDIALPDMTGYVVLKKMRARETTRRSAIIAVTGWGRQRDREKTRTAGFDEHLVKPVDPAAVITLINARARLAEAPGA
jgi:PAS domain S-box-containing protein